MNRLGSRINLFSLCVMVSMSVISSRRQSANRGDRRRANRALTYLRSRARALKLIIRAAHHNGCAQYQASRGNMPQRARGYRT